MSAVILSHKVLGSIFCVVIGTEMETMNDRFLVFQKVCYLSIILIYAESFIYLVLVILGA